MKDDFSILQKYCSSLKDIELSSFNTENVIKMDYMFNGCISLEVLDITNFNTLKVELFDGIFDGCLDLVLFIFIN